MARVDDAEPVQHRAEGASAMRGIMFKLVSSRGTLLGHVTIPEALVKLFDRGAFSTSFPYTPPEERSMSHLLRSDPSVFVVQRVGHLRLEPGRGFGRDCVSLHGITLEEFETIPGCSYSVGAAYMRSLIGKD